MNALFTEEAMRLFHRVSCEMAYADQGVANQTNTHPPSGEIIVVEDDDEFMYDANQVTIETGQSSGVAKGTYAILLFP